MFDYQDFYKLYNAHVEAGYREDLERLKRLTEEVKLPRWAKESRQRYVRDLAAFLLNLTAMEAKWDRAYFGKESVTQLQKDQEALYTDILPQHYNKNVVNPRFAAKTFGPEEGPILAAVAAWMRQNIRYAYKHMRFAMHRNHELFFGIVALFQQEQRPEISAYRELIASYAQQRLEDTVGMDLHDRYGFEDAYRVELIQSLDWQDTGNLYALGEYVGPDELRLAQFMNSLPEEEVEKMAQAFAHGYRKGFFRDGKDILMRKTVGIVYPLGLERMMKRALEIFERDIHYIPYIRAIDTTPVNEQYTYDHRFDNSLYLNRDYVEASLAALEKAVEDNEEMLKAYGGPAIVESFGKAPYSPQSKKEALTLTEEQQQLFAEHQLRSMAIMNHYVPAELTSFTIIAFPTPAIGDDFEAVFHETVKVNTLDEASYDRAQQCIIDTLDKGQKVLVTGRDGNETHIEVALHPLENPLRQTNFYNCGADVNIPLGEVFTSPQLEGTNGLLHVKEAFLDGLKYEDLKLTFENGFVSDYSCSNFEDPEEGRKYIRENLLMPHATLPMGEFAIGTNTTAYQMARKYNILNRMPVLIVEKMGPHFAIGDTCFSEEEDKPAFNPADRKEVIARDNEHTLLRKTEAAEEAYYNVHTDITIPYDQLGQISAVLPDGSQIDIIRGGWFVLRGTDVLNEALREA